MDPELKELLEKIKQGIDEELQKLNEDALKSIAEMFNTHKQGGIKWIPN